MCRPPLTLLWRRDGSDRPSSSVRAACAAPTQALQTVRAHAATLPRVLQPRSQYRGRAEGLPRRRSACLPQPRHESAPRSPAPPQLGAHHSDAQALTPPAASDAQQSALSAKPRPSPRLLEQLKCGEFQLRGANAPWRSPPLRARERVVPLHRYSVPVNCEKRTGAPKFECAAAKVRPQAGWRERPKLFGDVTAPPLRSAWPLHVHPPSAAASACAPLNSAALAQFWSTTPQRPRARCAARPTAADAPPRLCVIPPAQPPWRLHLSLPPPPRT
eukprot:scaffold217212_cov26-Tisochrysis_lutea.AAC.1